MAWQTPPNWLDDIPISDTNLQIMSDDLTYLKSSAISLNVPTATTPDGVTTVFTIGAIATAASYVAVYMNGLRRRPTIDYTHITGNNFITFTEAPESDDTIYFDIIPT